MGLNLNDYEYALPNTITGSVPYGSGVWTANKYFQSECLIVPYGRTYKIEMIRVTTGIQGYVNGLYVGISRSLNANVWQSGSGHQNHAFYVQYPEVQMAPTNSAGYNDNRQVVMNNQSYHMGFRHDQNASTAYGGRTQYMLYSGQGSSTSGDGSWNNSSGMRVLSKDDGPIWLNSGDAINMWNNSNPGTSQGVVGQNLEGNYIISYIEYF